MFLVAHVTGLLILAFFILFAASKAEGLVSAFGRILAAWLFLLAVLHIVWHFAPGVFGKYAPGMQGHWGHHWGEPAAPPPAAVPAPAQPAAPKKP